MGTYIFCHIFCDNGDVRLCKNSTFSFQDINQKLNQKLLSCFIARFLVWQYCSFAPVQKNQNPSGASDCPGPRAVNVSQIEDLDSTANGLAGATRSAVAHRDSFAVLFRWFFGSILSFRYKTSQYNEPFYHTPEQKRDKMARPLGTNWHIHKWYHRKVFLMGGAHFQSIMRNPYFSYDSSAL